MKAYYESGLRRFLVFCLQPQYIRERLDYQVWLIIAIHSVHTHTQRRIIVGIVQDLASSMLIEVVKWKMVTNCSYIMFSLSRFEHFGLHFLR